MPSRFRRKSRQEMWKRRGEDQRWQDDQKHYFRIHRNAWDVRDQAKQQAAQHEHDRIGNPQALRYESQTSYGGHQGEQNELEIADPVTVHERSQDSV